MSQSIGELLQEIAGLPGCQVHRATAEPATAEFEHQEGLRLPQDLKLFLQLSDGVDLFTNSDYPLFIHGFSQIRRANPVIVKKNCEGDRSWDWFLIANDGNGDYLTIDLNPQRLGRCYDSFWDRHGIVGSCPVVATSFTDLLQRAVRNRGGYLWWFQDSFGSLGDAYDD